MSESIFYILLGLFCGALGAWIMSTYGITLGTIDIPEERSSHVRPTPTGGGIGLLLTFLFISTGSSNIPESLWLPSTFLALVSLFDDRLELSPILRLLFQFGAATSVVLWIVFIDFSLMSLCLLPFWLFFIVGTANFYNFMDGINGIAGITGVVGFGLIAWFTRMAELDSSLLFLSVAMSAACAGFLPFNIPSAKVFMGDVGSVLLGFVFAGFTFNLSKDLGSFLCFISFMAPFFADTLTTLYVRWRAGEKLTKAHRRHLYQVLVNELSYPHWLVASGYGLVQLIVGMTMIWAWTKGLWEQVFLGVIYSVLFCCCTFWVRKRSFQQKRSFSKV